MFIFYVPNLHDCDSDREHDQGDPLPGVQRPAQDEHREERRGEDLELVRHLVRHRVEVRQRLVQDVVLEGVDGGGHDELAALLRLAQHLAEEGLPGRP